MNFRKILLITGFIIISIGIAILLYVTFFRTPKQRVAPTAEKPSAIEGRLPAAEKGHPPTTNANVNIAPAFIGKEAEIKISKVAAGGLTEAAPLTSTGTTGLNLSPNGSNLLYYDKSDGNFYNLNPKGEKMKLSYQPFKDVENIAWSPTQDQVVMEFPDGSNIFYDFSANKQITLPKQWHDFDFNKTGDKLAFKNLGPNPENKWLAIANPDGTGVRYLEHLGKNYKSVIVDWSPTGQIVATYHKAIDISRNEVFFLGQHGENFRSMIVEGFDFKPQWSPSGKQLLYSVYNYKSDYKPLLWIVDASGDNIGRDRRSLNINTWANKCTFSDNSTLYCAVPTELPEGAGLEPGVANNINDEIYKINLKTGAKTKIAIPTGGYSINKIIISSDKKYLYFRDNENNNVYKILLK